MLAGFLLALFSSTITAFILLRPFFRSLGFSFSSLMGIAYLLGLGVITQIFMWLWIFGVAITGQSVSAVLLVMSLTAFFFQRRGYQKEVPLPCLRSSLAEKGFFLFVVLYVALNIVMIFSAALALPVFAWDSITSEAYKAKTVFYTGTLTQIGQAFYPNFPLYTLSAMGWAMFGQGVWEDKYMHLIFAGAMLSFTVIFYNISRRLTARMPALLALVLLFSSNLLVIHATLSYRDIFMMAATSLCVLGVLLWGVEDNDGFVLFASLFSGMSLLTKIEGLPYFPVYLTLFFLTGYFFKKEKKKILRAVGRFLAINGVIYLPFHIYKIVVGTNDNGWVAPAIGREGPALRAQMIVERFFNELFLWGNWNVFFWPLFIIAALILLTSCFKDLPGRLLLISVALFFCVYAATFFLTGSFDSIRANWCSISRYLMHFYPLAVLVVARAFYSAYGQKNDIIS